MKFEIPANMPVDTAKTLLSKTTHLSETEKREAWESYVKAAGIVEPEKRKSKVTDRVPLSASVNPMDILQQVAQKKITPDDAAKMLAQGASNLSIGYNPETGSVCVYGLQSQWPVSLYRTQWERLLSVADGIRSFMQSNAEDIAVAEELGKAAKAAAKKAA